MRSTGETRGRRREGEGETGGRRSMRREKRPKGTGEMGGRLGGRRGWRGCVATVPLRHCCVRQVNGRKEEKKGMEEAGRAWHGMGRHARWGMVKHVGLCLTRHGPSKKTTVGPFGTAHFAR